jgi:hypothetical protein
MSTARIRTCARYVSADIDSGKLPKAMFQNTHHIHIYDTELISVLPLGHPLHPSPISRNFPERAGSLLRLPSWLPVCCLHGLEGDSVEDSGSEGELEKGGGGTDLAIGQVSEKLKSRSPPH